MEENKVIKSTWGSIKMKVVLGVVLFLGMGLVMTNPAKAETLSVGGGLWDFGLRYNWCYQQSQYSNYWHPNYHRSSVVQDTTWVYSQGTYTYGGKSWKVHNSWSYAKIATYWYPWQWRSYYDYLTW